MGARVVYVGGSGWATKKAAAGYKGGDLDKALAAYDAAVEKLKKTKAPYQVIAKVPEPKISKIDGCIADLKAAITEYEKLKDQINKEVIGALKTIQSAGAKAAAELTKQSKAKDADEAACLAAADAASEEAGAAGSETSKYS